MPPIFLAGDRGWIFLTRDGQLCYASYDEADWRSGSWSQEDWELTNGWEISELDYWEGTTIFPVWKR